MFKIGVALRHCFNTTILATKRLYSAVLTFCADMQYILRSGLVSFAYNTGPSPGSY
jgi:hypothetical protein